MTARIEMPREALAEFCRKHHVRKLALFGSVLRDDFRPDSDVDVLVEFEPGTRAGYLKLAGMELELSEFVGRKVVCGRPVSSAGTSATRCSRTPRCSLGPEDATRVRHMLDAARVRSSRSNAARSRPTV
jgi:predicted nucleotidyltransferase